MSRIDDLGRRYQRAFTPPSATITEGLFVKRTTYSMARVGLYVRVHQR